jgi:hypothetical protein
LPFQHYRRPAHHVSCKEVATFIRYLWASPTTILGLVLCLLAGRRGRVSIVDGVVEAHGPALRWTLRWLVPIGGGATAMTLGHVVLGRDRDALETTRSHERVHVAQYERWGPLFVPAYLAASAWATLTGRHFYFDNGFEVEAFARERSRPTLSMASEALSQSAEHARPH